MKKWRVGSMSMGIFLIFLGITLFISQFNKDISLVLLRNWWPLLLLVLGVELVLSNYLLNKEEAKITYDLVSIIFVGLIGLLSLGVYSLQTSGMYDRLTEMASGRTIAMEYTADLAPAGPVDKVLLDGTEFWRIRVRIWDSPDKAVHAKVRGSLYSTGSAEPRDYLAAAVSLEQIGRVIYIRLDDLDFGPPWRPRPEQIDLMIPAGYKLQSEIPNGRLETGEFSGKIIGVEN